MENSGKKGQFFSLGILLAATILIIIFVALALIFPKVRYILIGVGFIVGGFIYVIKVSSAGEKLNGYALLIIFGLGMILIFGSSFFANVLQTSYTGSGLTIKSMSSNVNVISQDTELSGVWWLINAYSGGGQSISGTLTPEETKSLTGYQTKYPLEIKVSALNEQINYQIKNTGTQVYTYTDTTVRSSCSCTSSCITHPDASACPSGTTYTINFVGEANGYIPFGNTYVCERHCYKKTQVGVLGDVSASNVKGDVTVDLTANNEKISKTIEVGSSADFVSSSKGLIAQVQYPSNGWTGNYPMDVSHFKAMYDIFQNKNQWTLTSDTRYVNYQSQLNIFESFLNSGVQNRYSGSLKQQYSSALADLNNKLASLNSQVVGLRSDDLSITQAQVWGNRNDQNKGKITINTQGQLTTADLVFRVRADWLGIVINVGKPSIVSKTCQTFKAGDSSKITLQVKNIGSGDGNFVPSITCNNIKQTYNVFSVPIDSGETKSIEIPIDSGNFAPSSTTSDTCQIRVEEYNKPSNYATSSVTCSIQAPALCVEGSIDISGNCIRKCVNGKPTQLKCCSQGETLLRDSTKLNDEYGGYYCFSQSGGENNQTLTCKWYEQYYNKESIKILGIPITSPKSGCETSGAVYLAMILIVVLIVLIFAVFRITQKNNKKRRK